MILQVETLEVDVALLVAVEVQATILYLLEDISEIYRPLRIRKTNTTSIRILQQLNLLTHVIVMPRLTQILRQMLSIFRGELMIRIITVVMGDVRQNVRVPVELHDGRFTCRPIRHTTIIDRAGLIRNKFINRQILERLILNRIYQQLLRLLLGHHFWFTFVD